MAFSDKYDGCAWTPVELHNENAHDLALITLFAINMDDDIAVVGNSFIIWGNNHAALCLTAAHNFEEIKKLRDAHSMHSHPSMPADLLPKITKYLKTDRSGAIWVDNGVPYVCRINQLNYIDNYDVAIFNIIAEEAAPPFSGSLLLDFGLPGVGDEVAILANDLVFENIAASGSGFLKSKPACWLGEVTKVVNGKGHLTGQSHIFETTVPAKAGMSGAPIIRMNSAGGSLIACGVVSHDFSAPESLGDYSVPGSSTASALWPAMGLGFEMGLENSPTGMKLLSDLVKGGVIENQSSTAKVSTVASKAHIRIRYLDSSTTPPTEIVLDTTPHPLTPTNGEIL